MIVGTDRKGALYVSIFKRNVPITHVAFAWMTGEWPSNEIDHRDLNSSNNRWANLRPATSTQQKHNQRLKKSNTSGIKGVRLLKKKWIAEIRIDGHKTYLGSFDSAAAAGIAYAAAAALHHGEFGRAV